MNVNGIIATTNVTATTETKYAAASKSTKVTAELGNNILNASSISSIFSGSPPDNAFAKSNIR